LNKRDTALPSEPAPLLAIRPLTGRIGAEITNIILSDRLPAEAVSGIKAALTRYKMICFRNQNHVTDDLHEAFARSLGQPMGHPTVASKQHGALFQLDSYHGGKASSWHSDSTYVRDYPWATVLRAVALPATGGDTLWANMVSGYASLPQPLRDFAERNRAVHCNAFDYTVMRPDASASEIEKMREASLHTIFEAEHPIVRVIPETGERAIVLGHFFKRITGLNDADSQMLYALLQQHVLRPENIVRWTWQPGDVVIWDNRATQHYAVDDYEEHRVMRRITLAGDTPVSIDGQPSRQTRGGAA
jgi:taurine dioxygenase